jgi:hypothetical protein
MSSSVREALEGFLAGRVPADAVVIAVTVAYYDDGGRGEGRGPEARRGERLRAVLDVIERAAPGIVELASVRAGPGFEIRVAERAFPQRHEAELRQAALAYLASDPSPAAPASAPSSPASEPSGSGIVSRLRAALRRLFTASASAG